MPESPRGGVGTVCLDRPAQPQSMSQLDLEELAEIGTGCSPSGLVLQGDHGCTLAFNR